MKKNLKVWEFYHLPNFGFQKVGVKRSADGIIWILYFYSMSEYYSWQEEWYHTHSIKGLSILGYGCWQENKLV